MAVLVLQDMQHMQTPCHLSASSQPAPNDYRQFLSPAGTQKGMYKAGMN